MNTISCYAQIGKTGIVPQQFPKEQFSYFSLPNFDRDKTPSIVFGDEIDSNKFLFDSDVILISKLNPRIKRVWKAKADVKNRNVTSTEFVVLETSEVNNCFFYYYLQSDKVYNELKSVAIGSTNSHTRFKPEFLLTLPVNFPPIPQQQKIAKILSTCDSVIEKTEQAIAKYQSLKQGMVHDLFTRGIDITTGKLRPKQEDAPEFYKESELGWMPKEWEVKSLEEFLLLKSGDGITSESISNSGEYPVYGGNGLRGFTNIFTHNGDYVLIGRQGALCGNITLASNQFFASEHAVVVTILDKSNTIWVEHKLFTMNLNQYSEASAQPGLSVNKINKLLVSLPKETEQNMISERFLGIRRRIKSEQSTLSKYQQIKQGLMQDLLTGKVEVTPDIQ